MLEDIEDVRETIEIWGNIKHDFTGIIDERGVGNSNYRSDQIIEAINRSSRMM